MVKEIKRSGAPGGKSFVPTRVWCVPGGLTHTHSYSHLVLTKNLVVHPTPSLKVVENATQATQLTHTPPPNLVETHLS